MIYNIYSIYDADIQESSDLFLSANDTVAKKTFEAHLKKMKANNPYVNTESLLLINLGEYNTKITINRGVSKELESIDEAIRGEEVYFVDIVQTKIPKRLKRQTEEKQNNYILNMLTKTKEGEK